VCGGVTRVQSQHLLKPCLGPLELDVVELDPGRANQTRKIVGADLQRLLEGAGGLLELPLALLDHSQVIQPAKLIGSQRYCIEKTLLGGIDEVVEHEELSGATKDLGQVGIGDTLAVENLVQCLE
jgi:hypothetical protein